MLAEPTSAATRSEARRSVLNITPPPARFFQDLLTNIVPLLYRRGDAGWIPRLSTGVRNYSDVCGTRAQFPPKLGACPSKGEKNGGVVKSVVFKFQCQDSDIEHRGFFEKAPRKANALYSGVLLCPRCSQFQQIWTRLYPRHLTVPW